MRKTLIPAIVALAIGGLMVTPGAAYAATGNVPSQCKANKTWEFTVVSRCTTGPGEYRAAVRCYSPWKGEFPGVGGHDVYGPWVRVAPGAKSVTRCGGFDLIGRVWTSVRA